MKVHNLFLVLSIALAGCDVSVSTTPLPPATPGTEAEQVEAFEAAKAIVKALDRGEFDQVWDGSSDALKSLTYKVVFTKSLSATRGALGQPAPRGVPRIGFSKKIDHNFPEGEYAVVEVDTDFNGKIVTEKVVLVRESGQWKLVGYFMQKDITFNDKETNK